MNALNMKATRVRVDRLSTAAMFGLVVIPLFVVFLATASMSRSRFDVDAFTNVVTAWRLGTSGSVYLPDHVPLTHPDYVGNVSWIVAEDDSAVGKLSLIHISEPTRPMKESRMPASA